MTHSPTAVRDLLATHGLTPSRALGQNFVADPNTVRKVARLARIGAGDRVVEIGAGLGSLTLALIETGAEVVAVETDRHLVPILRDVVGDRARVVHADALDLDWDLLLGSVEAARPWVLVANLPYNIAAPIVLDLLAQVPQIVRMLVMVQFEVGERLAAAPGHKSYGIPSVKVQWWAGARLVGKVPATVFVPAPRVDSALVEVERRPVPDDADARRAVFALVEAGFGQRRKMLRRSLANHVPPSAFALAGIRPEARAEELTLADWRRLTAAVAATRL